MSESRGYIEDLQIAQMEYEKKHVDKARELQKEAKAKKAPVKKAAVKKTSKKEKS